MRPDVVPLSSGIRVAELMAALSMATDLAMAQPLEFALRSCVLAMRLGDALGLDDGELREVYYQALLRYIGCNAETHLMATIFGDELALREDVAPVDMADIPQILRVTLRRIWRAHADSSPLQLARLLAEGVVSVPQAMKESFRGHCEVAQRLAERMGFEARIVNALGQLYERWDGRGMGVGLKGEAIARSVRIVTLAQDVVTFERLGGPEAAMAMAADRSGKVYDPVVVECFRKRAASLLAGIDGDPTWETVLALEPGSWLTLSDAQFEIACHAIADFTDIKSPYTLGHSTGVAELAAGAARWCGLPEADAATLRRAGLLHDLGRVGVSAGIWGKAGPLSDREWERVRLHPYYTERVLARPGQLARLGALASLHHERLDGSGYHRGVTVVGLSPSARILAAADVYHAMTETRPHRPALTPIRAADELRREVRAGRLDGDAVNGVLAVAGHRVRGPRHELVGGLSEREVEVLRLIARGNTMKEVAANLTIAPKTVDNHVQRIYTKIGVSTRAGATLFAMEQDLLDK